MSNAAWPFLITRNQTLDYRTLLAPQFLIDAGATGVVIREADAGGDHPWPVSWRHVDDPKAGDLWLVFRSVAATASLVGGEDGQPLRDRSGRRIYLIEGLVVEGRNPNREAAESHLDRVHELAAEAYRPFSESTDIRYPATPSDPLPLPTTRPRPALPSSSRKRAVLVGLALLLVVAGVSIAILRAQR
jgi:hypothetical protein